jgi:muramoyltetrapeptide carboxypeptidase
MANPIRSSGIRNPYPTRTIVSGKASGELVGGNLTLISTTLGTPYEIDTKGKILFLEEVGEEPYRIDRMLTQLRLAGKFKDAKGIVFGDCVDCGFGKFESSRVWDFTFGEVLDNYFAKLEIPVFSGLLIGHSANQITLPIGAEVELDAKNCKLTLLESALA